LKDDNDNNNIYFKDDDIDVLICSSSQDYTIRLFWNGDSNDIYRDLIVQKEYLKEKLNN